LALRSLVDYNEHEPAVAGNTMRIYRGTGVETRTCSPICI
jgi:hypothetical protein